MKKKECGEIFDWAALEICVNQRIEIFMFFGAFFTFSVAEIAVFFPLLLQNLIKTEPIYTTHTICNQILVISKPFVQLIIIHYIGMTTKIFIIFFAGNAHAQPLTHIDTQQ